MNIIPANPSDVSRITAAAAADAHRCLGPTHFLENEAGEVRGYCSIGGVTNVLFWSHTGNNKFDSIRFVKESQELARALGKPVVYFCSPTSPFKPHMPGFGFDLVGTTDVYLLK